MTTFSCLTLDEIVNILDDTELEYEVDFDETNSDDYPAIYCSIFEYLFTIIPRGNGPFFEELIFSMELHTEFVPLTACTAYNRTYYYSCAVPIELEVSEGYVRSEIENVYISRVEMLMGGVSREHLLRVISMWTAVVCLAHEFFNPSEEESDDQIL
jgi:hypothetical protein